MHEASRLALNNEHAYHLAEFHRHISEIFMPLPVTVWCGGGSLFLGCASLSASWRAGFHQTLVDGAVEATNELNRLYEARRFKAKIATRSDVKNFGNAHLQKGSTDSDQILRKYSIHWLDKLITFWRSWVKDKVATKSNIWVSYWDRWRHPHWRLGVEISSGLLNIS